MADFSWLHAVPIGLLMFAGTTFGVVRRAMGKRASRNAFPGLGATLGLTHAPAETPGAAGTLKGEYRGYRVRIESETRARTVVSFPQPVAIELRNYEHWKRTPDGYEVVSFEDKKLNQWLKNRFAQSNVRTALARDPELRGLLSALSNDAQLREFAITPERVELVFDYGVRSLFPVAAAQQALVTAITLAQRVEHLAAASSPADSDAEV